MTETVDYLPIAPPPLPAPAWGERMALRVLQCGAIAAVLVVSTWHAFELDRFFVPKELVLHLTALLSGALTIRRDAFTRLDKLLTAIIVLGALSSLMATNPWLALRGLAIAASSLVIFRSARAVQSAGLARPLVTALGIAVALTCGTALLQTYGLDLDVFSLNRAPGGTLGNRNSIAHVAAFGLPLLLLAAMRAERRKHFLLGASGAAIATATLALTRSRGGWLAFAAVTSLFLLTLILSRQLRRQARIWKRVTVVILLSAAAVGAVLVIPNTLHWRSRNPYLQTVRRVTDYSEGSGRGRLVQYRQSLFLALRNPLFGTGPGNWPVDYPAHAARNDPSLDDNDEGMTANPWPSSDWIAWAAERGIPALVLIVMVFFILFTSGLRNVVRAGSVDEALDAAGFVCTVAGATVAGLFDAVLLLGLPSLLVWAALGALWSPAEERPRRAFWSAALAGILLLTLAGAVRSGAQLVAMGIYATDSDRTSLARGAQIDPGNYRLQMRLAHGGRSRCEHALAAHHLYPSSRAARALARGCTE